MIIFAELVNFNKSEEECVTRQDRMLYILKNSSKLLAPPSWSDQEQYGNIFQACYIDDFSKEKREKYDSDMYDEKKLKGQLAAAREEGLNRGREEGFVEGREEGRGEGIQEVAMRMLAAGMDVETVAEMTGLPVEKVKTLK